MLDHGPHRAEQAARCFVFVINFDCIKAITHENLFGFSDNCFRFSYGVLANIGSGAVLGRLPDHGFRGKFRGSVPGQGSGKVLGQVPEEGSGKVPGQALGRFRGNVSGTALGNVLKTIWLRTGSTSTSISPSISSGSDR